MSERVLDVRSLEVAYGPAVAVRNLTLHVDQNEIVALLGTNGAGKTSTLRGISGLVRPRSGRVSIGGKRLEGLGPARAVRAGMGHAPEGRRVFPGLTVQANLDLGGWYLGRHERRRRERLDLVFDAFPRLAERRSQLAGSLSGGEQQMLAIGRALMSDPKVLLVDELSLGLAPVFVDVLLERLLQLHAEGLAILLVEQFVHRALQIADRVYVLEKGSVVFRGTSEEASRSEAVEAAYMARSAS